jgi:hypothetical protein
VDIDLESNINVNKKNVNKTEDLFIQTWLLQILVTYTNAVKYTLKAPLW